MEPRTGLDETSLAFAKNGIPVLLSIIQSFYRLSYTSFLLFPKFPPIF